MMTKPSDPAPSQGANANPTHRVEDVTCLACGCLCDDLIVSVADGRIVEAARACARGREWFRAEHQHLDRPEAIAQGQVAALGEAIQAAADSLRAARAPAILGFRFATVEDQAALVAMADRIGAVIDPGHANEALPVVLAKQRIGGVSASFGEVKNRADLVLFWGVDPLTSHPRLWERLIEPPGRFVPGGRSERWLVVADAQRTATAEQADQFVQIDPDRQLANLESLRALVEGVSLDAGRVEQSLGGSLEGLKPLADRLRTARYGVVFFGPGLSQARGGSANVESLEALVIALNGPTRCVALELAGPGNPTGAEAVLAWQAGAPLAIDFARRHPRYLPGDADASNRLAAGAVDLALIVGDPPESFLPPEALERLGTIPSLWIGPEATRDDPPTTIALATSTPGIDGGGTVIRSDGVSLPLRPALEASRSSIKAILDRIISILG